MKKSDIFLCVFSVMLLFSLVMLLLGNGITGHVTSGSTVSNVTITSYLSISMSANLQSGILFGDISTLPATDINASHNYDGGSSASTMSIAVSVDSNTAVDFCIKANTDLTASGSIITLANETYSNSTSSSATAPAPANQAALTTSYAKSGINIAQGASNYYRVWLDIPSAQAPGTYNNSVMFEGVATGGNC